MVSRFHTRTDSTSFRALSLIALLMIPTLPSAWAGSGITADKRSVRAGDSLQLSVLLEGDLAAVGSIELPLTALTIEAGPYESTDFRWENGFISRSKVVNYIVRAGEPGRASAGPLTIVTGDGRRHLLPAIEIEIRPEWVTVEDPATALGDLAASNQRQVFLITEMEKRDVFAGEQVSVTWYLYATEWLKGYRITRDAQLKDFWLEDVQIEKEEATRVMLNGESVRRIMIRKAALYPLRAGELTIPPIEVVVSLVTPDQETFGGLIMRSRVEEVRRRSSTATLRVRPIPGASRSAVGSFQMSCAPPRMGQTGPVVIPVTVTGRGNLRLASAPVLVTPFAGTVEMQEGRLSIDAESDPIAMERGWNLLLFPRNGGTLQIPPIRFNFFNPVTAQHAAVSCGGWTVQAPRPDGKIPPQAANVSSPEVRSETPFPARPRVVVLGVLIAMALLLGLILRSRLSPKRVDLVSLAAAPEKLRSRLREIPANLGRNEDELLRSSTDLGEAYRASSSLVDLICRSPSRHIEELTELKSRLRDLELELEKSHRSSRQRRA